MPCRFNKNNPPDNMTTQFDSNSLRRTLDVGGSSYDYVSLEAAETAGLAGISRLPPCLKAVGVTLDLDSTAKIGVQTGVEINF